MRILHVSEAWDGGVSTVINTLCKHQAGKHDVAIAYCPRRAVHNFDAALYEKLGIHTFAYNSSRNPFKVLSCTLQLRAIIRDFQPDIIHLHSSFAGVYGRIFRHDAAIVYCPHGWGFVQESGRIKRFFYWLIERVLARRTQAIIEISPQEYRHARLRGIDAPVHTVVCNGVDDVQKPLAPIDFTPDSGAITLGYVGRIDHKKGFDIVYRYFQRRKPEHVSLCVIGNAPRSRAEGFNDQGAAVRFMGWVEARAIDSYMRCFDALVMPSRHEGFGLAALEAMRNGVPVIASRDTALGDIITHGETGFLIDLKNFDAEMTALLAGIDKIKLAEMGRNARHVYEKKFTATQMADAVMQVYQRARTAA